MKKTLKLELKDAKILLVTAEQEAIKKGWSVAIAVCDSGGALLSLTRLDDAPPLSSIIAMEKAKTSVLMNGPSGNIESMINEGRYAALSLDIISLEGGIPILWQGSIIGAIGVSGAKSDEDAYIAQFAITNFLRSESI